MTRSGTWYSFHFFEALAQVLDPGYRTSACHNLKFYSSMKVAKFHGHAICPGFKEVASAALWLRWTRLNGRSLLEETIEANSALLSPQKNPDVRIIYLYRNPFDRSVSASQRVGRQVPERRRFPGEMTPSRHLRLSGLEHYLKHHVSFVETSKKFPANILMVTYEALMRDPMTVFSTMLTFLGTFRRSEISTEAITYALNEVSFAAMQRKQEEAGKSFDGRPLSEAGSHMTDGRVGKWREFFTQDDVDFAESQFSQFGLSIQNFDLG
jgi:hypothetical protein